MIKRIACCLLLCMLLMCLSPAIMSETASAGETASLDDLAGTDIGVQTGMICDRLAQERIPDVLIEYYNTQTDALVALQSGKVAGWCCDEPVARYMSLSNPGLIILPERLAASDLAAVFPKSDEGQKLRDQYSAFVDRLWADGTMAEIDAVWFGTDEDRRTVIDYSTLPAANGTLHMATDATIPPFSFVKDGQVTGYDIDVAARFCQENGYGLDIQQMSFDSILTAVQTGKCDFAASSITITEERAESVLFSSPDYRGGVVMVVMENTGTADAGGTITSQEQLNQAGMRIGVGTGSASAKMAEEEFPHAEIAYFTDNASAYQAVAQGKADAFVFERSQIQLALDAGLQGVHLLKDNLTRKIEVAVGISPVSPIPDLKDRMNSFIAGMKADGTLDEMYDRWVNQQNETMPKIAPADNPEYTLRVATSGQVPPFSFYSNGELNGYDIELAYRFGAWLGATVTFGVYDYDAIIPAAASGKADCIMANLNVTPERAESIPFSDALYTADVGILVRNASVPVEEGTSFWSGLCESFSKTFIREDRWKLFASGVQTTLLITVLSVLFGTLLGFLIFMLCRNGNAIANSVSRFFMGLVQGMPMVVLLMILYYIVFGSMDISGVAVSVVGFTLTFGSAVFGLLKMGVGAIDKGQYEASFALGYTNLRTFFRIILPQAIPPILPAFRGEIVALIKATAVVGYIAVQDLTKMGDIVRSRTYEAFFPLIALTVIYFLLEGLLAFFVKRLTFSINPRKRKQETILKGITPVTDDGGDGPAEDSDAAFGQQPSGRSAAPMIRIEHLTRKYPNVTPLKDVSAEIREGDVISVIGPSGTGKSTLLRCINLLEKPSEGRIWIDGTEVTDPGCDLDKVRQKMGMVFQSFNLFSHLTIIENIMLAPMDLLGKSRQDAYQEGMRLLRMVGLVEKALNYPDELSGGQRQRIAIARTLAMNPKIILLDEPTSALDPTMVGEVQAVIRELAKTGKTMMIVTHEMNFARAISNRVFFMDEGRIYEEGTSEQIFDHPQKENTRRFIRKLKVLELSIESRNCDFFALAGEIDKYCSKNQISTKTAARIRLAFEELVQQTLLPILKQPVIRIIVEYAEDGESATMTVRYNGPAFDVTAAEEALSLKVLKSAASEMVYEPIDQIECANQVTLRIRAE